MRGGPLVLLSHLTTGAPGPCPSHPAGWGVHPKPHSLDPAGPRMGSPGRTLWETATWVLGGRRGQAPKGPLQAKLRPGERGAGQGGVHRRCCKLAHSPGATCVDTLQAPMGVRVLPCAPSPAPGAETGPPSSDSGLRLRVTARPPAWDAARCKVPPVLGAPPAVLWAAHPQQRRPHPGP